MRLKLAPWGMVAVPVSLFSNLEDNIPKTHVLRDFWELSEFILPHREVEDKREAPLFSPAVWGEGKTRTKVSVSFVAFGAIDVDQRTAEAVAERLANAPCGWILYTSHSHIEKGGAFRVLVPFSRPVAGLEWDRFWPGFVQTVVGLDMVDISAKDPGRIYFTATCPIGELASTIAHVEQGPPLDVDEVLRTSTVLGIELATSAAIVPTFKPTITDLKRIYARWNRLRQPPATRAALEALIEGTPLAEHGARDTTVFRLTGDLVRELPGADPEALAELFGPSISHWSDFDPSSVLEKIGRHLRDRAIEEAHKQHKEEQDRRERNRLAIGRENPYTPEEWAAAGDPAALRSLLISFQRSAWIWVAARYNGPYHWDEVPTAARDYLSPTEPYGVRTVQVDDRGQVKLRRAPDLIEDYGSIAEGIVYHYGRTQDRWDSLDRTLHLACASRRPLEPTFNADIQAWLELLGGTQSADLLRWVAWADRLEYPCVALYLEGAPGAGKSLLAQGLARLYSDVSGPTSLTAAIADFNDQLLHNPIVLADEYVPRDSRERARTQELREFVQRRVHEVNRKYKPIAQLHGATRLIIAANSGDLLAADHLTGHDVQAIADRILHIDASSEAAAYLATRDTSQWVAGDLIARHALALAELYPLPADPPRFLIQSATSDYHRSLNTQIPINSAICHWLTAHILDPKRCPANMREGLIRVVNGIPFIATAALIQWWSSYTTNVPADRITSRTVGRALASLSGGDKSLFTAGDRRTWFWRIKPENLGTWAESSGWCGKDEIARALGAYPEFGSVALFGPQIN